MAGKRTKIGSSLAGLSLLLTACAGDQGERIDNILTSASVLDDQCTVGVAIEGKNVDLDHAFDLAQIQMDYLRASGHCSQQSANVVIFNAATGNTTYIRYDDRGQLERYTPHLDDAHLFPPRLKGKHSPHHRWP